MLTIHKTLLFTISFAFLQACSGGGGDTPTEGGGGTTPGGGSTPGSDYSITANKSAANFTNGFQSAPSGTEQISVTYAGDDLLLGYAPGSSPVPWLSFEITNKTSTSATVIMDVVDSDSYLPNLYTTKIRISAGKGTSLVHHDVDVSMLVAKKVSFNGVIGDTELEAQTNTIISNTSDTWTISEDADWIDTSLVVNSTSVALIATPVSAELTSNSLSTTATLTNSRTNEEYTIPIEIGLENIYLFADQPALSFVSTETINNVVATLNVSNNANRAVTWEPTTDVDWLTLTQLNDGNQLRVEVDASKVTQNDISISSITIAATTETGVISDILPVNVFHSDNEVTPFNIDTTSLNINANAIVVSEGSPYVYVGVENTIRVYNQYTGALVDDFEVSPENTELTNLVIHPKGSPLIAQTISTASPAVVKNYKIDLANSNTVTEITSSEVTGNPYAYTGTAGRYYIITDTLEFADENLALLNNTNNVPFTPASIAIAKDTGTIFAVNNNNSTVNRVTVSVNDQTNDIVTPVITHSYHPTSLASDGVISDIAVASNEANIYIVSESSEWLSFNGQAFTDNGLLNIASDLLVIDDTNEVQGLYTPTVPSSDDSTSDINTHSVYVDNFNQPHFIRTVTFTLAVTSYETYTYKYSGIASDVAPDSKQELVNQQLIDSRTSSPTNEPYQIAFTNNNAHMMLFNTDENKISIKQKSYDLSLLQIDHEKTVNPLVVFSNTLFNIGSDWGTYQFPVVSWLSAEPNNSDNQLLTVALSTDSLTEAVSKEVFVYDKVNEVTGKIRIEFTVPEE